MLFTRIYDEDLAQASYFIGCQATGQAVVVDPRRDFEVYLDEAERSGMEISAVTETHIHADHLSGSRELAAATGAGPGPRSAVVASTLRAAGMGDALKLEGSYEAWEITRRQTVSA